MEGRWERNSKGLVDLNSGLLDQMTLAQPLVPPEPILSNRDELQSLCLNKKFLNYLNANKYSQRNIVLNRLLSERHSSVVSRVQYSHATNLPKTIY